MREEHGTDAVLKVVTQKPPAFSRRQIEEEATNHYTIGSMAGANSRLPFCGTKLPRDYPGVLQTPRRVEGGPDKTEIQVDPGESVVMPGLVEGPV